STDVYALGAILFEVLSLQPLEPKPSFKPAAPDTVPVADARVRQRAPDLDVPPELEAICVKATAARPEDRFGSAREICEAIDRYLAGERDEEGRRAAANAHADEAAKATDRAIAGGPGAADARRSEER